MENIGSKSVKELQKLLKDRGVSIAHQRKAELVDLVKAALEIGLEFDPDGVIEDREIILNQKLEVYGFDMLPNPMLVKTYTKDLSKIQNLSVIDIYNYLKAYQKYDLNTLRNYYKMEGYTMAKDGHVLSLDIVDFDGFPAYRAIRGKVKPRTREKDPVSKLTYYQLWIIIETSDSPIFSAYCTCKGGIEGCCRHVVATLFEVIDFVHDNEKSSVTSGQCLWIKRGDETMSAIPITLLDTSLVSDERNEAHPEESQTASDGVDLPDPDDFISALKQTCPNACMLDAFLKQDNNSKRDHYDLTVMTPEEKAAIFFECHDCGSLQCGTSCAEEFSTYLHYSAEEKIQIEKQTREQHKNPNWHKMRKYLLTASKLKTICHSQDFQQTAARLFKSSSLNEDHLPSQIIYGRKYEGKARKLFLRTHMYNHKKCKISVPGLMISEDEPFLGASLDGVLECRVCGHSAIEIKCLYKYRNYHPKTALVINKTCQKREDGTLELIKTHQYYYQVQGQMAVAKLKKCWFVAYTEKGIHTLCVEFDNEFWMEKISILREFYIKFLLPAIRTERKKGATI